jgi:uncharacterized RDD family membrane protein YckC
MDTPNTPCPLCASAKHTKKAKALYGNLVCKKCYYGFANRRQLAFFIDLVAWRVVMLPVGFVLGALMATAGFQRADIYAVATGVGWLLLSVFFCKDCFSGQSPGKALCGVKVINKATGQSAGIGASFKRNLPLLIPFMPLIVGGRLCRGHRLGDGWADTKVIWQKHADHPIFSVAPPAGQN